ncbi:hypothetical protein [Candidatus Ichthyocystis sparus]|uniref:hypothetical protein n=1 Tax=Candidatus Ichthyocystis sparus TaxID=1561004 RepID=UPI000B8995FA|nr:hypothetical protein [Candidatus Ichthyocystis sparus]
MIDPNGAPGGGRVDQSSPAGGPEAPEGDNEQLSVGDGSDARAASSPADEGSAREISSRSMEIATSENAGRSGKSKGASGASKLMAQGKAKLSQLGHKIAGAFANLKSNLEARITQMELKVRSKMVKNGQMRPFGLPGPVERNEGGGAASQLSRQGAVRDRASSDQADGLTRQGAIRDRAGSNQTDGLTRQGAVRHHEDDGGRREGLRNLVAQSPANIGSHTGKSSKGLLGKIKSFFAKLKANIVRHARDFNPAKSLGLISNRSHGSAPAIPSAPPAPVDHVYEEIDYSAIGRGSSSSEHIYEDMDSVAGRGGREPRPSLPGDNTRPQYDNRGDSTVPHYDNRITAGEDGYAAVNKNKIDDGLMKELLTEFDDLFVDHTPGEMRASLDEAYAQELEDVFRDYNASSGEDTAPPLPPRNIGGPNRPPRARDATGN